VTFRVVVVGDVLIDELVDSAGSTSMPGGSALNVAVGLSVLGVSATLIGMIGDDEEGSIIRDYLDRWDVDLLASPGRRGTGRAISDRSEGEPRYTFNSAFKHRELSIDDDMDRALRSADVVAISGFPFDDPQQFGAVKEVLNSSAAKLAIDPNPRSDLLTDRRMFTANLENLVQNAELVKIGDDDAALLYDEDLTTSSARYLALGAGVVLATAGRHGASVWGPNWHIERPVVRRDEPVVDTMGAGDATFAVALHALSRSEDWGFTLDRAMSIAAETIRHPGALLRVPHS
jgi:fructokinase